MMYYYNVLFIFYMIIIVIIAGFIAWNIIKTRKITNILIGAIALMMFIIRIFMIR